ncbi:uncharacterized protein LOC112452290 isoform X2 [Temnothorax curvispinosus]|uniref:Uncharacterized protein LOC112452290 isoform X2 n=1 Tax=Temnothorax curvispinosus TaxID=300111 RepID=A0A6J1PFG7_9HYME|nr:uncharacterized protein LOC112452290 isoform X2 [Temnothorax curvispinosus]
MSRRKRRKQCIDPAVASTSTAVSTSTNNGSTSTNIRPLTVKTGAVKKNLTRRLVELEEEEEEAELEADLNTNELDMATGGKNKKDLAKRLQQSEDSRNAWQEKAIKLENELQVASTLKVELEMKIDTLQKRLREVEKEAEEFQ